MQLSVIIVNFNVKYFLEQCLCSVINACRHIESEIHVIDNHSTDGSKAYFEGRFPTVQFTWCDENVGFSKANNLGLAGAMGEHVLFLNPDTILPEDCLEKCLQFLGERNDVGALGVRMLDGTGTYLEESKRGFPSPFVSFCKLTGFTALFPHSKLLAGYYLGHLKPGDTNEVDVLAGAFMMVKQKALAQTGGFDERFFMYGEDIDLSYRIQQMGFKNVYFTGTTILHFKGESTLKGNLHYIRLFYGAMRLFVDKHYSKRKARLYAAFINTVIGVKSLLLIPQKTSSTGKKLLTGSLLVVAGQQQYEEICSVYKAVNDGGVAAWLDTGELSPGDMQEVQKVLVSRIKDSQATGIVFSADSLTSKQIIALIETLPGDLVYYFHFPGSKSIVGSNSKNVGGETIPLPGG